MVFLDLKKVFNTVDHDILLQKLIEYGLDMNLINWFKSYLGNRLQTAKVNDAAPCGRVVQCGVPQGSTLGPLLFILYINDLTQYLNEASANLYAVDTAVFTGSPDCIDLVLGLKMEMETIFEWLKANHLTLNLKKAKFMLLGRDIS